MNVLYFETRDMWSPEIDDLIDEYEVDIEDEEYLTVSNAQFEKGRWLNLMVTEMSHPGVSLPIKIADE
jgi:hypothetical protein